MRLIDASGNYTINASDNTDHSLCFSGGIISVMDERGHCVCEFDAEDAPTVDAVVLPCEPGTTVYILHNNTDACLDCPHHVVYFNDEDCTHPDYAVYYPTIQDSPVCDKQFWEVVDHTATELFLFNHRERFGKTVFLTREEAEAAIAKMKGLEVGA